MNEGHDPGSGIDWPDAEPAPLRVMSNEALKIAFESHKAWLDVNGPLKDRPDLSLLDLRAQDLSNVDLRHANLRRASLRQTKIYNIRGAEFQGADLVGADLRGAYARDAVFDSADLSYAKLDGADLQRVSLRNVKLAGANLSEANLHDADFSGATGLSAVQLAGADVSNAKLPTAIMKFDGLKTADGASKSARRVFTSMLLGCLYCWLTIATTTDARLLTNSISSPLPILNTAIPIVGFYFGGPLILLALYVYFHLSLQRLWEILGELPAFLPDGGSLDRAADQWLLNGLIRSHVRRLRLDRPPLARLQAGISILLGWWLVPVTLVLFWLRYLRRQDWTGSVAHLVLLVGAISAAALFQLLTRATLRGEKWVPIRWSKAIKDVRVYKRAGVILGITVILSYLTFGSIEGAPPEWGRKGLVASVKVPSFRVWVPEFFMMFGFSPFADLVNADLSIRPPDWTGATEEDLARVKGARLGGARLRYASAERAFLVMADLSEADLGGAKLDSADLRGANLSLAKLRSSHLDSANLHGAVLNFADLCCFASLQFADLGEANIRYANLEKASLGGADLSHSNFQNSKLRGADLRGAKLQDSLLHQASLESAQMDNADLSGTDLQETTGLKVDQLKKALHWDRALLSADLRRELGLPANGNDTDQRQPKAKH